VRALFLFFIVAFAATAQNPPAPLQVARQYNITSAVQVQDNRSIAARSCNYHSFQVVSGTGSWSVQMEYADASVSGPWTSFGSAAVVTSASSPAIGAGNGYHNWIRFNTTAGTTAVNYSCEKDFFINASTGGGGGGFTLPWQISQGGTGGITAPQARFNLNAASLDTNIFTGPQTMQSNITLSNPASPSNNIYFWTNNATWWEYLLGSTTGGGTDQTHDYLTIASNTRTSSGGVDGFKTLMNLGQDFINFSQHMTLQQGLDITGGPFNIYSPTTVIGIPEWHWDSGIEAWGFPNAGYEQYRLLTTPAVQTLNFQVNPNNTGWVDRLVFDLNGNPTYGGFATFQAGVSVAGYAENNRIIQAFQTPYTTLTTDVMIYCNATSGPISVILSSILQGKIFKVQKIDTSANTCTVTPNSGTIAGQTNVVLSSQNAIAKAERDSNGNWWLQ
jgi:hypothetical protein